MEARPGRIPWFRRLGVRIGVVVALIVLLVDQGSWVFYDLFDTSSPEDVVWILEEYERTGEIEWFTPEERRDMFRASVLFALVLAVLVAWIVSRVATRRLSRLAEEAAGSVSTARLPGPFEVQGTDEIGSVATSLNVMRTRIAELLGELEQRDEERRTWIAQVSHDLRTPMTALSVGLERVEALLGREDPTALEEASAMVAAASLDVRRVQALAEDLLEIARLDAGEGLHLEPVPMGELLRQTVLALQPVAREHGLELVLDGGAGLPTLEADGRRLQRALENLVANALRHARTQVVVRTETDPAACSLTIVVADDGPGFEEHLGELTPERLSELPRTSDSAGLGLQVVSRVAVAHEGSLSASNAREGGAIVRLRLPATG